MQTSIQDFYRRNILPLPDAEQLKLASLILERVTKKESSGDPRKTGPGIRELFGRGHSGDPTGSDNEKIDADLARAYVDSHDDE